MGKRKQDFPVKNLASKKYRAASTGGALQRAKKAAVAQKFGTRAERTPEVKFIQQTASQNGFNDSGAVLLLNGCVEGTAYNNRIGQKIEVTSLSIDFAIAALGAVTAANGYPFNGNVDAINVFLVYDRQANGAAPSFTDIYNGSGSALAPFGHRNVNNLERFEVLKKGTYKIDSAANNMIRDSWYLPCHHETRYNGGNAGTIADIQTGSFYLVFVDQNTAVVGAASMAASVDSRVRFHDM